MSDANPSVSSGWTSSGSTERARFASLIACCGESVTDACPDQRSPSQGRSRTPNTSSETPAAASSGNERHPAHGRPADERTGDEERERRDGHEVPVDVDERVQEVRGQDERERKLVPTAAEAAAQERSCTEEEQDEPDDARLGEELQRQVVRLDREVEVARAEAKVREVERAGAAADELVAAEFPPGLPPPDEAEIRARGAEPPAAVPDRPGPTPLDDDEDDGGSHGQQPPLRAGRGAEPA